MWKAWSLEGPAEVFKQWGQVVKTCRKNRRTPSQPLWPLTHTHTSQLHPSQWIYSHQINHPQTSAVLLPEPSEQMFLNLRSSRAGWCLIIMDINRLCTWFPCLDWWMAAQSCYINCQCQNRVLLATQGQLQEEDLMREGHPNSLRVHLSAGSAFYMPHILWEVVAVLHQWGC